ncbi:MAG: 23S rRNA (pseudouridine(1915)-N(3))-methyltransferase RlmH [Sphingobacteriales bacterium]|nr:MAG: 23S rRNA (pseudouridine(1915)-N(3))-methyltransferase RlmH [Sphingobacteriales bacterium]
MKVAFWAIGKTDEKYLLEGIEKYTKRLGNYLSFEYKELYIRQSQKIPSPLQHKQTERDELLKIIKPTDFLILLDEAGKEFNSVGFANFLQKKFNDVSGNMIFLIGGAYGFHDDIYARANAKIALSQMTFTHQMVRLIFLEQLYRAMTILKNEPYHH